MDELGTAISVAKNALTKLVDAIDACTTEATGDIKVVIYQAFWQNTYFEEIYPRPAHLFLPSFLNDYASQPVFGIFLSTAAQVTYWAPKRGPMPSGARATLSGPPHVPITETPFDCAPGLCVRMDTLTKEDVARTQFIAQFGRP